MPKAYSSAEVVGRTFNSLTILALSHKTYGTTYVWAKCVCGRIKRIGAYMVISGKTRSCGCAHRLPVAIGATYGRLTVKSLAVPGFNGSYVACQCDCGNELITMRSRLLGAKTRSCGCLSRDTTGDRNRTHGMTGQWPYSIWTGMRNRCNNPRDMVYKDYGGRGIRVCKEWDDFVAFREWALANGGERGLTIDRIDNDGPYSPANCRWVTRAENCKHTRRSRYETCDGRTQTLTDWLRELGVTRRHLVDHLMNHKGLSFEQAVHHLREKARTKQLRGLAG